MLSKILELPPKGGRIRVLMLSQRLVREATFTHLNRLVAIQHRRSHYSLVTRVVRQNGLPHPLGFANCLRLHHSFSSRRHRPAGIGDICNFCGDELAADLPQLFDPRNPLLELDPVAGGARRTWSR